MICAIVRSRQAVRWCERRPLPLQHDTFNAQLQPPTGRLVTHCSTCKQALAAVERTRSARRALINTRRAQESSNVNVFAARGCLAESRAESLAKDANVSQEKCGSRTHARSSRRRKNSCKSTSSRDLEESCSEEVQR